MNEYIPTRPYETRVRLFTQIKSNVPLMNPNDLWRTPIIPHVSFMIPLTDLCTKMQHTWNINYTTTQFKTYWQVLSIESQEYPNKIKWSPNEPQRTLITTQINIKLAPCYNLFRSEFKFQMIHKCIRIPSIQWTPTIPQLTFKNTNNRVRVGVLVNYLSANDTLMNHLNEKQNVI